jgi:hypothetical protein
MRRSSGSRQTVSATPRQLESLVRLSEAIAKMRYEGGGGSSSSAPVRVRVTHLAWWSGCPTWLSAATWPRPCGQCRYLVFAALCTFVR